MRSWCRNIVATTVVNEYVIFKLLTRILYPNIVHKCCFNLIFKSNAVSNLSDSRQTDDSSWDKDEESFEKLFEDFRLMKGVQCVIFLLL